MQAELVPGQSQPDRRRRQHAGPRRAAWSIASGARCTPEFPAHSSSKARTGAAPASARRARARRCRASARRAPAGRSKATTASPTSNSPRPMVSGALRAKFVFSDGETSRETQLEAWMEPGDQPWTIDRPRRRLGRRPHGGRQHGAPARTSTAISAMRRGSRSMPTGRVLGKYAADAVVRQRQAEGRPAPARHARSVGLLHRLWRQHRAAVRRSEPRKALRAHRKPRVLRDVRRFRDRLRPDRPRPLPAHRDRREAPRRRSAGSRRRRSPPRSARGTSGSSSRAAGSPARMRSAAVRSAPTARSSRSRSATACVRKSSSTGASWCASSTTGSTRFPAPSPSPSPC